MKRIGMLVALAMMVAVPAFARQDDTAGVAKTRAAYEKASNAHDAAGLAKLFTPDGTEMPPNAPAAKGRAAIEAMHKTMATMVEFSQLKITATDTKFVGDLAYEAGTYTQTVTPKGGKPMPDKGKVPGPAQKGRGWRVAGRVFDLQQRRAAGADEVVSSGRTAAWFRGAARVHGHGARA